MVNPIVFDYFQKNRYDFSLEALKEKALSSGYSADEVEEVIDLFNEGHVSRRALSLRKWIKIIGIVLIIGAVFGVVGFLLRMYGWFPF